MDECDDLIDRLHAQARTHVHLAVIAEAASVVEMHVDLAVFSEERARAFEELCDNS
jgi:hypothetical protein